MRSAHQNNLKTLKTYYFKKKIQIFSKALLKSTPKRALKAIPQETFEPQANEVIVRASSSVPTYMYFIFSPELNMIFNLNYEHGINVLCLY